MTQMRRISAGWSAVLVVALVSSALAGEQGHYTPNSWSPRDLISAPPGLAACALYGSYYNADKATTGSGDTINGSEGLDVGADSWMVSPVIVYASKVKPFGADWAFMLMPAYGNASANARLAAYGENITLFDNDKTGMADLYAVPANLTWHLNSHLALSAQYAFWAPVGEYDSERADNVGLGYWSHDFRSTVSYFPLGNQGLLLSASVVHEVNGEKDGYDLTPAPHTSGELGASMAFSERFMCGAMFGGIWETGDAKGSDATEDGRDRVLSASFEASYWFLPGKLGAMARVTKEFEARDRFEGKTITAGLNYLF